MFFGVKIPFIPGSFKFERIGTPYDALVPVSAMRVVPAFFGSLLMPTIYNIMVELGLSHYAGALAAFLAIFGEDIRRESFHSDLVFLKITESRTSMQKIYQEIIYLGINVIVLFIPITVNPSVLNTSFRMCTQSCMH